MVIHNMADIRDNNRRGLDIQQREYIKAHLKQMSPASNTVRVEPHERHNDPYDFIIYQEMSGRVYKKYVEVKSGNSPLSKREEEFKQQHPHSYIELRVSGDSRFHNFKDEVRSMISPQEWREFLQI